MTQKLEWIKFSERSPERRGHYLTWSMRFHHPQIQEYPAREYECPLLGKTNTWKGLTHWAEIPLPFDET